MKRTDNSLKGLILAAGVAITCLIISVGFFTARSAKSISADSNKSISEYQKDLSESDLSKYDGLEVSGSDVVNLIKEQLGEYVSTETAPVYIYVKTSSTENTYKNNASIVNIQDFTNTKYIKPTAKFTGLIVRDANKVIIGVKFTQK